MARNEQKSFLLQISLVRFFRSFFYSKIFLYSKYIYAFVFLALISSLLYVYFYRPDLEERVVRKYFEIISSNRNLGAKINISGNDRVDYETVLNLSRNFFGDQNQNDLDLDDLKKNIEKLPWVKEVTVTRSLPNNLNIIISEYQPFSIWIGDGSKYLIDKDGKIITIISEDNSDFDHLMILSGKGANDHVHQLFNILTLDPEISQNIYSATWVGGRRWDIRFENNLLVKLPESGITEAWARLIKIYNIPGSLINLNSIDLRIDKKIYLEYNDKTTKEIKLL